MRQILFYVTLDHPFSILPNGTQAHPLLQIGAGILLLFIFCCYALWFWKFGIKQPEDKTAKPVTLKSTLTMLALQLAVGGTLAILFVPVRIFPVFGYGMMLLIAFVTGAAWAGTRAVKVGYSRELIWDLAMCILVSGVAGARIFYLVQKRDEVYENVNSLQDFLFRSVNLTDGGLVFYGGMILATITYFIFCKLRKVRPISLADVVIPSVFLGLGFGRIGCLLNGCCYGDRCDLPWAITFPPGSVPHMALVNLGFLSPESLGSFPLHPSQIYSSIGGFLLAFVTAVVFRYRRRIGEVLAVGAIFYPINRFLIEFVRGDEFTVLNTGLTPSQNVSILIVIAALAYLVWLEFYGEEIDPDSSPQVIPKRSKAG